MKPDYLYGKHVDIITESYISHLYAKPKQKIIRATNAFSSVDSSDNKRILLS
jgi:hypothetical protein